jgi:hypothetical protein
MLKTSYQIMPVPQIETLPSNSSIRRVSSVFDPYAFAYDPKECISNYYDTLFYFDHL